MGQNVALWLFSPQKIFSVMVESLLKEHYSSIPFYPFSSALTLTQALQSENLSPQRHLLLWIDFDHEPELGFALLEQMMAADLCNINPLLSVYVLVPQVLPALKVRLESYPCVRGLLLRNLLLTEIRQVLEQQSYMRHDAY